MGHGGLPLMMFGERNLDAKKHLRPFLLVNP